MNMRFRAVISFLSLFAATAGYSQEGIRWEAFRSDEHKLAVNFPGPPDSKVDSFDGPNERITSYRFTATIGSDFYSASRTEMPFDAKKGDAKALKAYYDAQERGESQFLDGSLVSSREIKLGKHSGREYVFTYAPLNGGRLRATRVRSFLVGSSNYVIRISLADARSIDSDIANRFLGSLEIDGEKQAAVKQPGAKQPDPKQADKVDVEALKAKVSGKWKGARYLVGGAFADRTNEEWWIVRPDGTYEATKFIVTARVTEKGKWRIVDGNTLELTPFKDKKEVKTRRCTFTLTDQSLRIRYHGLNEEVRLNLFAPVTPVQPNTAQETSKVDGPNPLRLAKVGAWAKYDLKMDGDIVSRLTLSVTENDGKKATVQLASESVRTKKTMTSSRTVDLTLPYPVALLAGYKEEQNMRFTKVRSEPETIKVADQEFKATRTEYTFRQPASGLMGTVTTWTANDGPSDTLLKREITVNGIITVRFSAMLTAYGG